MALGSFQRPTMLLRSEDLQNLESLGVSVEQSLSKHESASLPPFLDDGVAWNRGFADASSQSVYGGAAREPRRINKEIKKSISK